MTTREEFERWVKETGYSTDWSREGGGLKPESEYLKPRVREAWACWQAALASNNDAVYAAYLGVCVLRTMCRAAGLTLAEQRAKEVIIDLGRTFSHFASRSAMRSADGVSEDGK